MAVGFLAMAESHTGTTGSASQASFTFAETLNTSTARCAVVFCFSISATAQDTSVTVGGSGATLVSGSFAADTATEVGCVRAYFIDNVPQSGTASVVVNRVNNATVMWASAASFTAAGACEVHTPGIVLLQENGALAEQSVTDGSPGTNSMRVAGCYYGGAAPAPQGASSSLLDNIDFSAFGCSTVRETTAGQGARNVGFTQATADDRAAVHFAIRETPAAPALPPILVMAPPIPA